MEEEDWAAEAELTCALRVGRVCALAEVVSRATVELNKLVRGVSARGAAPDGACRLMAQTFNARELKSTHDRFAKLRICD